MKQTIDINLGGIKFTFDKDAYSMLDEYFSSLESLFKRSGEDISETVSDIEARCAELICAEYDSAFHIVTVHDVASIIDRLGDPEEIMAFCMDTDSTGSHATPPPYNPEGNSTLKPVRHKLYRAPWDKMLGGVCGGISAYLGLDSTYVRLAWIVLTIITATVPCIVYLILWIIVPEARTPLQRLELMGETPSLGNIGETVTEAFRSGLNQKVEPTTVGAKIVRIAVNIFKVVLCILGVISIPVLIAIIVGIATVAWFLINIALGTGYVPASLIATSHPYLYCIFMIVAMLFAGALLLIPLYAGILPVLNKKNNNRTGRLSGIILLVIILGISTFAGWFLLR